ncbi:DUF4402 domain-containing protein [Marinomonas sp. 15G1-11]|uniref:DUF4402 domain-containing protein n=1 Tax=Marinomonas phaeophyticola TaxID=3004091 RepID=A0ABT4JRP4_9GAMM|nr:DUF4402 domain-containing protein [Marinomonas sp. 15G1-11]MCZ2720692.1 DUF4402 domain-containing protein [Marinomonas sp. 15G1-11]
MVIKKTQKHIVIGSIFLGAASFSMAETVNTTATVTVQNAFNLVEATPFTVGTIRATADPAGTETATVVIPADGSAPTAATSGAPAAVSVLTAGTPATYTVDSAAGFTSLTLTLPAAPINLTAAAAPPGTPKFTLGTFTGYITSGPNNGTAYAAANLQTDATGAVSFSVGATLTTDAAASTSPYIDGDYTGTFPVIVIY